MPNRSKEKGSRTEREIVRYWQDAGFAAERIPLSGSCGGSFAGDVRIPILGRELTAEVKCRATGFRELYDWLSDHDLLVVKADRQRPLVVIPLAAFTAIAKAAEWNRSEAWRGALNRDIPWTDWPAEDEEAA